MQHATARNTFIITSGIVLIACFVSLSLLILRSARKDAINKLYGTQFIHAEQASRGIEDFFERWRSILGEMAGTDTIAFFGESGRRQMDYLYQIHRKEIKSITRVDENGRILYTVPYRPEIMGTDISTQRHIKEIFDKKRPVVSDVFNAVQGYQAVAFHVPILKNGAFRGTIAIIIDFEYIAKRYLDVIKIGDGGYAWMLSREGIELYCPVPGHTGKSIYETSGNFPSIIRMAHRMMKGERGTAEYQYNMTKGRHTGINKKYASFMPVSIENTFWSIVVATPENEVLSSISTIRNRIGLVTILALIGCLVLMYFGIRGWLILREEEKRKLIEQARIETEMRFRAMFDSAAAAIIIIEENRMVDCNRLAEEMFECDRESFLSHSPSEFSPPFQPDGTPSPEKARALMAFPQDSMLAFEWQYRTLKGKLFFAEVNLNKIEISGKTIIQFIIRDITERKITETALLESRTQMNDIIENLPDATVVIDREGYIIAWNRAIAEMTGMPAHTMIGKGNYEYSIPFYNERRPILIDMVFAEHDALKAKYAHLSRTGDTIVADTKTLIGNEKPRSLWGFARPIYDTRGTIVGAIETIRDITDIREYEEKIKTALDEKETLLSELYHRTKNNMATICSMMRLQQSKVGDAKLGAVIREIESKIQSMALVHSKLYQSQNLSSIDLSEYAIDLAALIIKSFHTEGKTIEIRSTSPGQVSVMIDTAIPCGLILNELIVNSIKHGFPDRSHGVIGINIAKEAGTDIAIEISDDGVGFPENFDYRKDGSMGLQTILALAERQLKGKVIFSNGDGIRCRIVFSDTLYSKRV